MKVLRYLELKQDRDFNYNGQDHILTFRNESKIFFGELKAVPSDPMFDRLGSYDLTGAFIDEAQEVSSEAKDTLITRLSLISGDGWKISPKILMTCNPKRNWIYSDFVRPTREGNIDSDKIFIPALYTDNPFIDQKSYRETVLATKNRIKIERLLHGNFEYDENPNGLCSLDSIIAIFENDHVGDDENLKKYITCDVARHGSDRAIICVWYGWAVVDYKIFDLSNLVQIQDQINSYRSEYKIPKHHCVADEDGVGGGVVDNCKIKGFINNSKAVKGENYQNLQTQCGYYLADKINDHGIYFEADLSPNEKELLISELTYLRTYKNDEEGKKKLFPKKEIKKLTGRSPDWRDVLLMRSYFDLKPKIKSSGFYSTA